MSIPTKFNPMGADNDNNNSSGYLINPIMLDNHTIDTSQPHDYIMDIVDYHRGDEYELFDAYDYSGITIPRPYSTFMEIHFDRPLKLKGIEFISMVYPNTYYLQIYNGSPWRELYRGAINMGESSKFVWYNNSSVITTDDIYIEISTSSSNDDVDLIGINFMLTE